MNNYLDEQFEINEADEDFYTESNIDSSKKVSRLESRKTKKKHSAYKLHRQGNAQQLQLQERERRREGEKNTIFISNKMSQNQEIKKNISSMHYAFLLVLSPIPFSQYEDQSIKSLVKGFSNDTLRVSLP